MGKLKTILKIVIAIASALLGAFAENATNFLGTLF